MSSKPGRKAAKNKQQNAHKGSVLQSFTKACDIFPGARPLQDKDLNQTTYSQEVTLAGQVATRQYTGVTAAQGAWEDKDCSRLPSTSFQPCVLHRTLFI